MSTSAVKSIVFHEFRDTTVILEFEIEEENIGTFKRIFKTDKYIDTLTWHKIMMQIDRLIGDVLNGKIADWQTESRGDINLSDSMMRLTARYKILPKADSRANCEKCEYKLDWFIKVLIKKEKKKKLQAQSSTTVRSSESESKSSETEKKENVPVLAALLENSDDVMIIEKDIDKINESDDDDDGILQKEKRAKTDGTLKSNYSLRKTPMKKNNPSTLDGWLSRPTSESSSTLTNVTKRKKDVPAKTLKRKMSEKSQENAGKSRNALDCLDPQQLERIGNFIEKQEEEERKINERKEELKDLEILSCHDVTNEQLKKFVLNKKDEILKLFDRPNSSSRSKILIENCEIDQVIINTSSILNNNQHMYIMKQIEQLRQDEDRGSKEDIMSDMVMPYIRIELFKDEYCLTTAQAIDRIKLQEEKRDLFNLTCEYDDEYY